MAGGDERIVADPVVLDVIEESAEDLYENAPCGYLSTLGDGTIVKVNETFLRWTGHRREDLVRRKRFHELLTAGGRIYYETHYAPLLRMQGTVREIAVDLVCSDGRRLPALINAMLIRDDRGEPLAIRTTILDATERRGYEQELLRERKKARESETEARLLARTLQESLIPPEPARIPGLEVAAAYRPAGSGEAIGGDFYDVFETANNNWVAVIGDVSGKGADAARVTAAARYTLRAAAMRSTKPRLVLSALNDALLHHGFGRFCTVAYSHIAFRDGTVRVTVACAGHPLPVIVSPDATIRTEGRPGTMVGAFEEVVLEDTTFELKPGEAMILYTDGIPEGRRRDGAFYREDRLHAVVAANAVRSAAELCAAITDDVVSFQGGHPRDDIALLVVRAPGR
ncbi:MAG TPA: SpoIIE family protein phosphatase [Actinomycetota bacterium]|nr:SpoIIE family protein phosphatase [Actinomycetota bacterium]